MGIELRVGQLEEAIKCHWQRHKRAWYRLSRIKDAWYRWDLQTPRLAQQQA